MADELEDETLTAIAAALEGCPSADFKARLRASLQRSIDMATAHAVPSPASGRRPGFTAVTPYLMAQDIEPVIAFAKRTFGAEEIQRATGGAGGIHCELRIGDSMLMCGGAVPGTPVTPRIVGLHVYVDDVDAVYQRALEAGGISLGAPADRPYGERAGFVKDPAGNHWYIATRTAPTYFAQEPHTVTPHFYVQRTAERGGPEFIAFLEAAFGGRVELRHEAGDRVRHAVVRVRGAAVEIGEGDEPGLGAPAALCLYVDECEEVYEQAIRAGGTSLFPPAKQAFGGRMGGVADAWGNEWFIATHERNG